MKSWKCVKIRLRSNGSAATITDLCVCVCVLRLYVFPVSFSLWFLYPGVLHCCNEVQTRCTWGRKCFKAPVQQQKGEVLHLIGKHPNGNCDGCQQSETIHHVFYSCPEYNRQRLILKTALEQHNIKDMDFKSIYESKSRNEVNKLIFKFLKNTGLRRRIWYEHFINQQ